MVAYAMEISPALLPLLPELMADLDELGTDPDVVVAMLEALALPADATVLDLGCGKGAVSIEVADELELSVLGVDLFEPFVAHCREAAAAAGVADRCRFLAANIATLEVPPADVVIYGALGDVLGRLDETVGILRRYVKPGGVMIVSDPYLRAGDAPSFPGFESLVTREETLRRLQAHGDVVEGEVVEEPEVSETYHDDDNAQISQRVAALADQHPHLREALLAFASSQQAETDYIEESLVAATWLLRRAQG